MDEGQKHGIKQWLVLGGPMVALAALLLNFGFCTSGVQTTNDAIKAQLTAKTEWQAQAKLLSDQAEKREELNQSTHEKIFDEMKAQRTEIAKTQLNIMQLQIDTLKELKAITNAPTGATFNRGRAVKP